MVSLEDAAAMAMALPGVTEGQKWNHRTWVVNGKGFAWERPFSKADIKRFLPDIAPDGPILAVATEDLGDREAILAANRPGLFTIAHFAGYPAYLVQLNVVDPEHLHEAILDGWLACAPPTMAKSYLEQHPTPRSASRQASAGSIPLRPDGVGP
jgi:hypothetical protein